MPLPIVTEVSTALYRTPTPAINLPDRRGTLQLRDRPNNTIPAPQMKDVVRHTKTPSMVALSITDAQLQNPTVIPGGEMLRVRIPTLPWAAGGDGGEGRLPPPRFGPERARPRDLPPATSIHPTNLDSRGGEVRDLKCDTDGRLPLLILCLHAGQAEMSPHQ
ncbi:hypothetical protein JZ751_014189, partial [Albula glossodonta]